MPDFPYLSPSELPCALPPIPRLVPSWERLMSLAEPTLASTAHRDPLGSASRGVERPHEASAAAELGIGLAVGASSGALLLIARMMCSRRRQRVVRAAPSIMSS